MKKFIEFILIAFPFVFLIILFLAGDIVLFGYCLEQSISMMVGFVISIIISSCASYFLFRKIPIGRLFIAYCLGLISAVMGLDSYYNHNIPREIGSLIIFFLIGTTLLLDIKFNTNFIKMHFGDKFKSFKRDEKLYTLNDVGWRVHTINYALSFYVFGISKLLYKYCPPNSIENFLFVGIVLVLLICIYYYNNKNEFSNPLYGYSVTEPEPPHNDKS